MRIADLIREYLYSHPEGAFTEQITLYCIKNGAQFNTSEIKKSVSGQLSKMRSRGEVVFQAQGRAYCWKLVR